MARKPRKDPAPPPSKSETRELTLLASRIREAIEQSGKSQTQIGHLLGVSKQTVGDWARGRSSPTLLNLTRFAKAVNIDVADLILGLTDRLAPDDIVQKRLAAHARMVPVYRSEVAAMYMTDGTDIKPRQFVPSLTDVSALACAVEVTSDANVGEGGLHPGEIVIVDPGVSRVPGRFVFVKTPLGSDFRRYQPRRVGTDEGATLATVNPLWPDDVFDDDVEILGTVVQKITPL